MKKIRCPRCHGDGKIDLPNELADAAKLVSKFPGRTTEFYAPAAKTTTTAMSMRLHRLVGHRLIQRWREGRFYVYTPMARPRKK